MRSNTPITEMNAQLIDRNTRIYVSTLFSNVQLSNLCEPLEGCLDCEFYRVQVSWNHFLVRWYNFTSFRKAASIEKMIFSLYIVNPFGYWILRIRIIQFDLFTSISIYIFICIKHYFSIFLYLLVIPFFSYITSLNNFYLI